MTTTGSDTSCLTIVFSTSVEGSESSVEAPETHPGLDGADTDNEQQEGHDGGTPEAAMYRRKAEAERDGLRQRLETLQRADAERLAGQHLAKGAAVWAGGTELADVLDHDGDWTRSR